MIRRTQARSCSRPFLEQATRDPAVKAQLAKAQQTGLIGAVPDNAPLSFQHLHDTTQALDDLAKSAFKNGQGNLGRRLSEAKHALVSNLEAQFPAFKEVSQRYSQLVAREKMLVQGDKLASKLFNSSGANDTRELAQWVNELPVEQLTELRHGMAARLMSLARAAQKNRSLAARIEKGGKAMQDQLEVLFGDKATFDQFMANATHEANLAELSEVLGGSPTARRMAQGPELGLMRNLLNFNLADAALSLGRGRSSQAVADALAPDVTRQGSSAVQGVIRKIQQRSVTGAKSRAGFDAAGGQLPGLLFGDGQ
jgi:hypothetical protein